MATKHSDKGMATLAGMNTTPEMWQLTEIKWVREMREVRAEVTCPACKYGYFSMKNKCETCRDRNPRSRCYGYSTGKVMGRVTKEVMVGYPQFPVGTLFVSRFVDCGCQLCGKELSAAAGRVPVHAVRADGRTVGMFVGMDCAKKFLNVKVKLPEADATIAG